jgi:hypothetical protein
VRIPAFVAALFLSQSIAAQTAPPVPCAAPEFRQFDFWVGEWTVNRTDTGVYAGANRIERILEGCVLHERWVGAKGFAGQSFNVFDVTRKVWHQTWVDQTGSLLVLEGGLRNGNMVLEGEGRQADGTSIRNRIAWTPLPGGKVRQRWDATTDGGKSWSVVFDGIYTPRAPEGEGDSKPGSQPRLMI